MKSDIILAGVGGQGIISIAAGIGLAALKEGYFMKQSEVHGMSQRGGAVQSHLRISKYPIHSDLIPLGKADMIISVEPMESLRYLSYLSADGWLITSLNPFINVVNYPDTQKVLLELAKVKNNIVLDAENLARNSGSMKSSNMVVLGAASTCLQISEPSFLAAISELFGKKGSAVVEMNIKAFSLGRSFARNKAESA
jgi:indolepyruvate ferredoxin oxidoreductase, beta subunit